MIFKMSFGFALNKVDELNTLKILKGYDGDSEFHMIKNTTVSCC